MLMVFCSLFSSADNIMIVRDQGDPFTVKLIDFGSCQPKGGVLPPDAHTTRFYWSPEIWQSLNHGVSIECDFSFMLSFF